MKVVVITGSAHRQGTSHYLADAFCEGAASAGHQIMRHDTALLNVKDCLGCNLCTKNTSTCVHIDDFIEIRNSIVAAESVVFVSPVYFFSMTAQMKRVIDRLHACVAEMKKRSRKAVLITTGTANKPDSADVINMQFERLCAFFGWEVIGKLNAGGVPDLETICKTDFPERARDIGRTL